MRRKCGVTSTDFNMAEAQNGAAGNVYVLEVRGFDLPVCKIGMTKKDPEVRCVEINNSSTGDFIWAVKYFVRVNDSARFESLVHRELKPHRQRRRGFFEISPDEAFGHIRAILARQTAIKEIAIATPAPVKTVKMKSSRGGTSGGGHVVKKGDELYSRILHSFLSRLQVKGGRPFGQWRSPRFGLSDGVDGVQWNIFVNREDREIWLGVNLEGMAYHGWPIATFILSEIARPTLGLMKANVGEPDRIRLTFSRDAWQKTARLSIAEQFISGRRYWLSEIDGELWRQFLTEARGCLDESRQFRARAAQVVTLSKTGEKRKMPVSPHLMISRRIEADPQWYEDKLDAVMDQAIAELRPIHEWVATTSLPQPLPNLDAPFTYDWNSNWRIAIVAGAQNLPFYRFISSEEDHRQTLEACRVGAERLLKDLRESSYGNAVRREYSRSLEYYLEDLPRTAGAGNILLANDQIVVLGAMLAQDDAVPFPFVAELGRLIAKQAALNDFYDLVRRYEEAVAKGRWKEPFPTEAARHFFGVVDENTPRFFEPEVGEGLHHVERAGPPAELTAEETRASSAAPQPPDAPKAEHSRQHQIATAANALWAVFLKGKDLPVALEGWAQAAHKLSKNIGPILDFLRGMTGS
jgi:hypothetical protein